MQHYKVWKYYQSTSRAHAKVLHNLIVCNCNPAVPFSCRLTLNLPDAMVLYFIVALIVFSDGGRSLTSTSLGHDGETGHGSSTDAHNDGCAGFIRLLPPGLAGIAGSACHHLEQGERICLHNHGQQLPEQQQLAAEEGCIQRLGLGKRGVAARDDRAGCTFRTPGFRSNGAAALLS